jgi:hypothetical protein
VHSYCAPPSFDYLKLNVRLGSLAGMLGCMKKSPLYS